MRDNFEPEIKWFAKKLLQIRILEIRGFSLPVPFKLSEIENCTAVIFDNSISAKEHLEELVEEIRGYYIRYSKKPGSGDDIRLTYPDSNLTAKIYGIDSELLREFLIKRLHILTSLLETKTGNELFYVDLPTGIVLSATEQTVLKNLRDKKETNEILSYNEIFEICARHKGVKETPFRGNNNTSKKKASVARGMISDFLVKILESKLFKGTERKQIIKNVSKKGYQLIM